MHGRNPRPTTVKPPEPRGRGARLALTLTCSLLAALATQARAGDDSNPKRTLHRTIDPCAVASESQLRDILQAALGYAFPLAAKKGSASIRLSHPDLHEIFCPNLALAVQGAVQAQFREGTSSVTRDGRVRLRAPGKLRVEYRAPLGSDQPETPRDVWNAQTCLTHLEVTALDLDGVPDWLDSTLVQDCLSGDLSGWVGCREVAREMCRDTTDRVQDYVAQGGEL